MLSRNPRQISFCAINCVFPFRQSPTVNLRYLSLVESLLLMTAKYFSRRASPTSSETKFPRCTPALFYVVTIVTTIEDKNDEANISGVPGSCGDRSICAIVRGRKRAQQ